MTIPVIVEHILATEGSVAVAGGFDLTTGDRVAFLTEEPRTLGEAVYDRHEIILTEIEPWQIVRRHPRPTPTA